MELTDNILKGAVKKDEIQLHAQKEVKKRKEHLGILKVHPGQRLWELNLATKKIDEAEVEEQVVYLNCSTHVSRSCITKEDCMYVVAITKLNAARKFLKLLNRA